MDLRVCGGVFGLAFLMVACAPQVSSPPASNGPTSGIATDHPVPSVERTAVASADPTPDTSASRCGEVLSPTRPTATMSGRFAVYSTNDAIFVYDASADAARALGPKGAPASGLMPRFRTADQIWFAAQRLPADDDYPFGQDSLYEVVGHHEPIEVLRLPNMVVGHDWSPNGERLAYLVRGDLASGNQTVQLCLYDSRAGTATLVRRLGYPDATGTGQRDETSVRWSPDGRLILVVDTAQRPSLLVSDLAGQSVVEPRDGTFGRWLNNETVLFQEDPADDEGSWRILSTVTGEAQMAGLPREAHRPAVSPAGNQIAFDDGRPTPSVFVFDVATGSIERIANGQAAPLWLDDQVLAMTTAGPCISGLDCTFPWKALGAAAAIDVESSDRRPLALPSTVQVAYRRETIDAWVAEP